MPSVEAVPASAMARSLQRWWRRCACRPGGEPVGERHARELEENHGRRILYEQGTARFTFGNDTVERSRGVALIPAGIAGRAAVLKAHIINSHSEAKIYNRNFDGVWPVW